MLRLDFDRSVGHYDVQPACIPVQSVPKGYTVDLTVHYLTKTERPTELFNIKLNNIQASTNHGFQRISAPLCNSASNEASFLPITPRFTFKRDASET
jgi:hypothetical protein